MNPSQQRTAAKKMSLQWGSPLQTQVFFVPAPDLERNRRPGYLHDSQASELAAPWDARVADRNYSGVWTSGQNGHQGLHKGGASL